MTTTVCLSSNQNSQTTQMHNRNAGSSQARSDTRNNKLTIHLYTGKSNTLLKFLDEVVNVFADFVALFLVDKMGNSFHYNNLF